MPSPRIHFPWNNCSILPSLSPRTVCRSCLARQAISSSRPAISMQRTFTSTPVSQSYLFPKRELKFKDPKGRPRVNVGGSTRGTTVIWGDYGLRMKDHDRRVGAWQFKNGEEVIRRRLRGTNFRLFSRWTTSTAVYTKGNESRMGTGKGKFDYWAARVPVSRIIFEISADSHEQVIRDAMRLAANKMPGLYEFVKRGDPPVMGVTKLSPGVTAGDLKRPRKKIGGEHTTHRLSGTP